MRFRFEHDFEIDAPTYWEIFFSEDYNVDLYAELKMKNRTILKHEDDGKVLRRTQRLTPVKDIPGFLKTLINDMSYTEHDVFHRERSAMDVTIEPALLRDRFDMRGVYSVQPLGEARCRRVFEGEARVSIPLLGGRVEKYMVEEMRVSYDVATAVTRRWIAKRKAATKPTP